MQVDGDDVALDIELGYPAKSQHESIRRQVQSSASAALPGAGKVTVNVTQKIVSHAVQRGVKLVPGVKNIIAVASRQGRRRQVDHRGQPRAGARRRRRAASACSTPTSTARRSR